MTLLERRGIAGCEEGVMSVDRLGVELIESVLTDLPRRPTRGSRSWVAVARAVKQVVGRCEACDFGNLHWCPPRHLLDVHHVVPRAIGGSDVASNLIVLCPTCHRVAHIGRSMTDIEERYRLLQWIELFRSNINCWGSP